MFLNHNKTLEQKIKHHEEQLRLLEQKMRRANEEMAIFTKELGVDLDKLTAYALDPQNFSEQEWQDLVEQRKEQEAALKRDLCSVKDPLSAQTTRKQLLQSQNWIPMK